MVVANADNEIGERIRYKRRLMGDAEDSQFLPFFCEVMATLIFVILSAPEEFHIT
jgi:hypothetical protein